MGVVPVLDEDGRIVIPGRKDSDFHFDNYQTNPCVTSGQAAELLGDSLPFHDSTAQFLEKARAALLERCDMGQGPQVGYDAILGQARQAITECLRTEAVTPIALGYLAVGNRVGEVVAELDRSAPRAFNLERFQHISSR